MKFKAKPLRSVLYVPGNKEDWIARRVGKRNRGHTQAALCKVRHLLGEVDLNEPF
ncbi:MAG: hypothetical protein IIC85_06030 [Chloroflexi bacterium]|nr:hypothetical protein [Chloroflexota bacterium]